MQPLSAALKAGDERPVDFRDPGYIERVLMNLPPTTTVDEQIANLTRLIGAVPEGVRDHRRAAEELAQLEVRRTRCQQRDILAVGRPEGCWCLGNGGRIKRYTQSENWIYDTLCICPEGEREKVRKEQVQGEERRIAQIKRAERFFGRAQIPARFKACTLDSYPVTPNTQAALDAIRYWRSGPDDAAGKEAWDSWLAQKRSLLLHGPYGVGKTGLAVGILREEMDADGGLFFTVPTLLDHIRRTYGPNPVADEHEIVQQVKTTPFLVLDDLGAERVTEWVREKLFTIINHRHDEDLPTVFTSNLDVAELGQHIGERTTWRIVEMCEVIHVDGPNLRK